MVSGWGSGAEGQGGGEREGRWGRGAMVEGSTALRWGPRARSWLGLPIQASRRPAPTYPPTLPFWCRTALRRTMSPGRWSSPTAACWAGGCLWVSGGRRAGGWAGVWGCLGAGGWVALGHGCREEVVSCCPTDEASAERRRARGTGLEWRYWALVTAAISLHCSPAAHVCRAARSRYTVQRRKRDAGCIDAADYKPPAPEVRFSARPSCRPAAPLAWWGGG